jgi:hypothetical protein
MLKRWGWSLTRSNHDRCTRLGVERLEARHMLSAGALPDVQVADLPTPPTWWLLATADAGDALQQLPAVKINADSGAGHGEGHFPGNPEQTADLRQISLPSLSLPSATGQVQALRADHDTPPPGRPDPLQTPTPSPGADHGPSLDSVGNILVAPPPIPGQFPPPVIFWMPLGAGMAPPQTMMLAPGRPSAEHDVDFAHVGEHDTAHALAIATMHGDRMPNNGHSGPDANLGSTLSEAHSHAYDAAHSFAQNGPMSRESNAVGAAQFATTVMTSNEFELASLLVGVRRGTAASSGVQFEPGSEKNGAEKADPASAGSSHAAMPEAGTTPVMEPSSLAAGLLDSLRCDLKAVDAALDNLLAEIAEVGDRLWTGELRLPAWAMAAVVVVGGAAGRRAHRRRTRELEEGEEESSEWLFDRLLSCSTEEL